MLGFPQTKCYRSYARAERAVCVSQFPGVDQGSSALGSIGALATVMLLALTSFSSCKTTEDDESALRNEDLPPGVGGGDEDLMSVPLSLWSPAQRQASAGYYYLVAETIAMRERDPRKALPIFVAAYNLEPNPFLGGKMIAAKAAAGEREGAVLEAKKMVLLYPRDADLRYLFGELLTATGQLQSAIAQFERCIELDPRYESAYLDLIEIYRHSMQTTKATVIAKELVETNPNSLMGWTQLSRLYLANGQYKKALVPARRAWEMSSNNPGLSQIYAIVLQLNGKTKRAIRIYERLYRMNPASEELMSRMVDLYREIGNLEDALSMIDQLVDGAGEKKPGLLMQKAIILWELKRFDEASALLNQLMVDFPESDRIRYMAGFGREKLEDFHGALQVYQSVPHNSTFRYHADFRRVIVLKGLKKLDEAIALAKTLLSSEQREWDLYAILSGLYADQKNYSEAVRVLDTGYKQYSDKPRLLFLKGVYQERAGDIDGCIVTMREVIEKDPTNSSAYNYLGYLFAERSENLDEAEQLIRKALELKPNDGFYLDSLGWVYFQRGEYDKAKPHLEEALKLQPQEGVILEHLGDVQKAKGDLAGAEDYYNKALKGNLEDRDRERVEKKLQKMKSGGG